MRSRAHASARIMHTHPRIRAGDRGPARSGKQAPGGKDGVLSTHLSPIVAHDDSFDKLSAERQDHIAEAAIEAFGKHAYKDASTEEIARQAGMSKGLLFFYCKSKKQLYLRTMEYLYDKVIDLVVDQHFWEIDDFFELMYYTAQSKAKAFERYPWALSFCIRAFYPDHHDIKATMNAWNQQQIGAMFDRFLVNIDWSRFRDDIDPKHALNMLIWLADGWMHQQQATQEPVRLEDLMEEFQTWLPMVRAWAYKPEFGGAVFSETEGHHDR